VGIVPELLRGIRLHFGKFVKSIDDSAIERSQLGLGHSYSRCKVKFNVHRSDNMIIQAISILDQLDKDINTFSMRVKEWYGYHFPELVKVVPDNYDYARAVRFIKRRGSLTDESLEGLEALLMDSGKAQAVLDAARHSMGMEVSEIDLLNIDSFAMRVVSLSDYRKQLHG
jgi:nucleolar protein 56